MYVCVSVDKTVSSLEVKCRAVGDIAAGAGCHSSFCLSRWRGGVCIALSGLPYRTPYCTTYDRLRIMQKRENNAQDNI